jgi:cyclic pyranopterin phosphate synthase
MLSDRFNRLITYLRISVTDRCNFRCVYCMPAEGVELSPRAELLTFEEIEQVARVGAGLGVRKIRLTGGEPTVRKDLPQLVGLLRNIPGIEEVNLTTNAARLEELAEPLKAAGIGRLNISIDTLDRVKAAEIARRDYFEAVQRGIGAAYRLGISMKFNTVVMRGTNDDELGDLVEFATQYRSQIRFIEYMPMGVARFDEHNKLVTASEIRERLAERFDFNPAPGVDPSDPARIYVCSRTGAKVGFITSMSEHFCGTCNRMRLTALGGLRPCLHQNAEVDVRQILRGGASSGQLETAIRNAYFEAAGLKWAGHHMNDVIPLFSAKDMVSIGG